MQNKWIKKLTNILFEKDGNALWKKAEQQIEEYKHLELEDYLIFTEDVFRNGYLENIRPSVIEHLRMCEECNYTATNFLLIQGYLYQIEEKIVNSFFHIVLTELIYFEKSVWHDFCRDFLACKKLPPAYWLS